MNWFSKFRKNPKRLYLTYDCIRRLGLEKGECQNGLCGKADGVNAFCYDGELDAVANNDLRRSYTVGCGCEFAFAPSETFVNELGEAFVCDSRCCEAICSENTCEHVEKGRFEKVWELNCENENVSFDKTHSDKSGRRAYGSLVFEKRRKMLLCDVVCAFVGAVTVLCVTKKVFSAFKSR